MFIKIKDNQFIDHLVNMDHVVKVLTREDEGTWYIVFTKDNIQAIEQIVFKDKDKFEECRQSILKQLSDIRDIVWELKEINESLNSIARSV